MADVNKVAVPLEVFYCLNPYTLLAVRGCHSLFRAQLPRVIQPQRIISGTAENKTQTGPGQRSPIHARPGPRALIGIHMALIHIRRQLQRRIRQIPAQLPGRYIAAVAASLVHRIRSYAARPPQGHLLGRVQILAGRLRRKR